MKTFFLNKAILALMLLTVLNSCIKHTTTDLTKNSIIPKPIFVEASNATFELTSQSTIYVSEGSEELLQIGDYLKSIFSTSTGFILTVKTTTNEPPKGSVFLTLKNDEKLGEEGYDLSISSRLLHLSSNKPAGLVRGIQTLRQLFPAEIEADSKQEGPWLLATGVIRDFPEYVYRGAMLDVSRHFFGVEDVKKYIDYIAMYKMNTLHLHLSDDQGWRIEIKSWPNLTKHGGSTQVGGGPGGFYTQEEYKEIVQYAQERYIAIVPEIDMPGHTNAALASYPELNADGKAPELYTGIRVGFSTLDTQKEVVYQFIDDVVRELSAITPGPYFHIGGDESRATEKEDYIYFVNRVQSIVESHGKDIIGWDEIANATLTENALVQYWGEKDHANVLLAVGQGAKVIMSPSTRAYLDIKYDSTTVLGLDWSGTIEVDKAYDWYPETIIDGVESKDILGIEAPLWSETLTNINEIEYLLFPRIAGHAEIGWTRPDLRQWDEYKNRLAQQKERFELMDINFYPSPLVPWKKKNENDK